jgi:hypothetical protein
MQFDRHGMIPHVEHESRVIEAMQFLMAMAVAGDLFGCCRLGFVIAFQEIHDSSLLLAVGMASSLAQTSTCRC